MLRSLNVYAIALSFAATTLLAAPAKSLDPSGSAVRVVPAAAASGGSGRRTLEIDGPVFMGDQVTTDRLGEAQIRFRDKTRLVVGPNSRLTIDRFVYNPDKTARAVGISAAKGTFRFITGVSRKQAYSIRTPTMSIGVRGTRFDFAVRGGQTILALYEGGARLCDAARRCIDVEGRCTVVAAPGRGFSEIRTPEQRTQVLNAYFPYVKSQAGLLREFRVDVSGCRVARTPLNSPDRFRERSPRGPDPSGGSPDPDGSGGGTDSGGQGGGDGSPDGS